MCSYIYYNIYLYIKKAKQIRQMGEERLLGNKHTYQRRAHRCFLRGIEHGKAPAPNILQGIQRCDSTYVCRSNYK